jgi:hypothetical protein
MAYQGKPAPARINRTPAPDEITNVRHPSAAGPGMSGPQPSVIPAGQASESVMASNLRQSQADSEDVLSKVIAGGIAGRDDRIPSDNNAQTRNVSAQPYPTTYGMTKRPAAKIPGAK